MPKQIGFQGTWYRQLQDAQPQSRNFVWNDHRVRLYQPLHGIEPSIFPLEIRLGLEAGLATPALTARGPSGRHVHPEWRLGDLKRNHGVCWSVATLRRVVAALSEGMEPHRHDASVAQVLKWLEQATPREAAASQCWPWVVTD